MVERGTLSVIVPCHNYGRFLGEAIESVDRQDRRPEEIVICDDGSTDGSWDDVQRIAEGRADITAYRHEEAWGLIRTFNELVERSTGDLIVPLSADDRLGPGFLRRMEDDLLARDLDFGYSDYRCFGAEDWYFRAPEMDVDRLARANFISGTAGIRRSVFDEVGGYSPAFERLGFEDYDFWLRVVEAGKVGARVDGCHLEWRRHPGGSRNTATRRVRLHLRWKLLVHHPRFFLHPRTLRAWRSSGEPVGTAVDAP